jgi:ribosomal protection tetracycline resistance protein
VEIIIDGYNLIGLEHGMRGNLEHQRSRLIQKLGLYEQLKKFKVIVVFDAWQSGRSDQVAEKQSGLTILYSAHGEKADDVIVRTARQKGSGCVVVTSDREVRRAVEKFGAAVINSGEFAAILRRVDSGGDNRVDDAEIGEDPLKPEKKGNPRQLAKAERRRLETLKKLRI